jgi:hypothetical protein
VTGKWDVWEKLNKEVHVTYVYLSVKLRTVGKPSVFSSETTEYMPVHDCKVNWLTPWSRVILENLIATWLVKKFLAFHGTPRFIIVFTRAYNWSLSFARCIQSTPSHPISLRVTLILSFHLCLCFQSGLFPSGFPTKILYTFFMSQMHATYPDHLILLDMINLMILGEVYKLWRSHYAVFSSLLSLPPS